MTLTGIGEKNISAFAPLMSGFSLDDVSIAVGAMMIRRWELCFWMRWMKL